MSFLCKALVGGCFTQSFPSISSLMNSFFWHHYRGIKITCSNIAYYILNVSLKPCKFEVFQKFSGKSQITSCYKMSINFSFQHINMIILFTFYFIYIYHYSKIWKTWMACKQWRCLYFQIFYIFLPFHLQVMVLPFLYPSPPSPMLPLNVKFIIFFSTFKLNLSVDYGEL